MLTAPCAHKGLTEVDVKGSEDELDNIAAT